MENSVERKVPVIEVDERQLRRWQRCSVHFYRNVQRVMPRGKIQEVSLMFKAIHAQEDRESARRKAEEVASKLRALRLDRAACIVAEGCEETLA